MYGEPQAVWVGSVVSGAPGMIVKNNQKQPIKLPPKTAMRHRFCRLNTVVIATITAPVTD